MRKKMRIDITIPSSKRQKRSYYLNGIIYLVKEKNVSKKKLERDIVRIIEHETIHFALEQLDPKLSFLFDIIEYQTLTIWNKRIPSCWLFINREDKISKEKKHKDYLRVYRFFSKTLRTSLQRNREELRNEKIKRNLV